MTDTLETTDLETWLEHDIPCGKCDNAATYVIAVKCHGQQSMKCDGCTQNWLDAATAQIERQGSGRCPRCHARHFTINTYVRVIEL